MQASPDQHRVARRRALVVHVDRDHGLGPLEGVRHIEHRDQFTADPLAQKPAGDRATQHDVRLAGVAHRLMGQHARQGRRQHHGVQAAAFERQV